MGEKIAFLLRYAILAPSSHNSQPWWFSVVRNNVEIRPDLRRWLRVADPDHRELHISLGCALENFLIAAERFGFGHEVVYPVDGERGGPAACVTLLAEGAPSTCRPADLFATIASRATHRGHYEPRPVPEDATAQLRECAVDGGVGLFLTDDPGVRRQVRELVVRADRQLFSNTAWRREMGEWIGVGALGDPPLKARATQLALTWLDLGGAVARRDAAALAGTPIVGLLYSARDDRESRVRVGQAFERLTLMAARRGLATQPLSQIVELPEIRRSLQALLPDRAACPQHPFRLGYARAAARPTPRRPVEAVLA
jgi:nitroreductase